MTLAKMCSTIMSTLLVKFVSVIRPFCYLNCVCTSNMAVWKCVQLTERHNPPFQYIFFFSFSSDIGLDTTYGMKDLIKIIFHLHNVYGRLMLDVRHHTLLILLLDLLANGIEDVFVIKACICGILTRG